MKEKFKEQKYIRFYFKFVLFYLFLYKNVSSNEFNNLILFIMASKFEKDIDICPFTGIQIKPEDTFDLNDPDKVMWFGYKNKILSGVIISHFDYIRLKNKYLGKDNNYLDNLYIYKGIIRNYALRYSKPFIITFDFIDSKYKDYYYPDDFKQKVYYFLKLIYENGGKEFKTFNLNCYDDYALSYAQNSNEFQRIIEFSESKGYIEFISTPIYNASKSMSNVSFRISIFGIEETEKELPIIPMFDLVRQDVFTGNTDIDEKIFHSKKLFFTDDLTLNSKKSACERLSNVLEPIRKDLIKYFGDKDIRAFFDIVNNFDIRHNNSKIQQINKVEQLEWIYYSFLNTIIVYYKILKSENQI